MEFFLRNIYPWLIEVSSASVSVPLLVGLYLVKKRKSLLFKLLLFYTVFIALTEAAGQLTVFLGTNNNLWINHIYVPVEFALLAAIYYISFKQQVFRRGVVAATLTLLFFSIYNVVWGEQVTQMNSLPRLIGGAMLIGMAVLYFYEAASELRYRYLDQDPMFLISSGLIVYQAGTAVAFSIFNQALEVSYDAARMCLTIILVLNILFRIILMLALKRAD